MFSDLCPQYMAMGMTYDEYWNGEADKCMYAREAHQLKIREANERDCRMGYYVYDAVSKLYPLFNPFAGKNPVEKYREFPLPITQADIEEQEEIKIQRERKKFIEQMNAKIQAMAKSGMFDKKEEDNG